jgi:hypothetical protein
MNRRQILDEYRTVARAMEELSELEGAPRVLAHERIYLSRASLLWNQYIESLPHIPVSRCPFTGELTRHSLDVEGLDGLWWRYQGPARAIEDIPPTLCGFTGALRLGRPLEWTSFLVKPGPEQPYVISALLNDPSVAAVVSSVKIGVHSGYVIAYYYMGRESAATHLPSDSCVLTIPNPWGADGPADEVPGDYDFDLGRWLAAGKLYWISPGDSNLQLRNDAACPYIGLPGKRDIVRIQWGKVW